MKERKYFLPCPNCKEPFIYLKERPRIYSRIDVSKMILPSGREPKNGDKVTVYGPEDKKE